MNNKSSKNIRIALVICISITICILLPVLYTLKIKGIIKLDCVTYTYFGITCPACGITRMVGSILQRDFKSAFMYNQVMMILIPYMIYIYVYGVYQYIKYGFIGDNVSRHLLIFIIIITVWGILRNIPGLEILSPNK